MISAKLPHNEEERLKELYKFELLDSAYEVEFDEIVQLASQLCNVPISLITLVDMNRQWFKARLGLDVGETERNVAFCAHAILQDGLFEVPDAVADERFFDNPLVTGDPNIRYYAGMPLVTNAGYKIGTLCVIDREPRALDKEQAFALKVLSKQVVKLFELRIKNKDLKKISDVQQKVMAVMAHDIRGPLTYIKASYDMKNEGFFTDAEMREMDKLVPEQLNNTISLLNNIVDWAKLQLSDQSMTVQTFNLYELCEECLGYMLLSAKAKGNTLLNNVDKKISMRGQRQGLEFVLRNLLANANKYTSSGTVTVTAVVNDDELEISVKDTGVGMSAETQNAILQRSWTNSTYGTQKEKGSGMGLKLIYEYLAGIDGSIYFASAPGEGTNAIVKIPVG